jgi:phosphoribosylanthranilate isomerase
LVSKFQNIFKNKAGAENLIATFNYTNVQIHGDLNKSILGYGDETTEQYKILEDQNDFEYIKFMKSSQYKRDDAYNKIHLFINQ